MIEFGIKFNTDDYQDFKVNFDNYSFNYFNLQSLNHFLLDFTSKESGTNEYLRSKAMLLNLKLVDNNFIVTFVNDYLLENFNVSRDFLINQSLFDKISLFKDLNLDKIAFKVLKEHQESFEANFYDDGKLMHCFVIQILKTGDNTLSIVINYDYNKIMDTYYAEAFRKSLKAVAIFQNNTLVYVNSAFADSLGYSINELLNVDLTKNSKYTSSFDNFFLSDIQEVLSKKVLFKDKEVTLNRGDDKKVFRMFLSPFTFQGKPAVQVTGIDITNKRYKGSEDFYARSDLNLIQYLGRIASFSIDVKNNKIISSGFRFLGDIGTKLVEQNTLDDLLNVVYALMYTPDVEKFKMDLSKTRLEKKDLIGEYRLISENGDLSYFKVHTQREFSKNGELLKSKGYLQDVTKIKEYEYSLNKNISDKNILLRELHHRVRNNLQILLSLISLEMRYNDDYYNALLKTQNRMWVLSLLHSKVYTSEDLISIGLLDYLNSYTSRLIYQSSMNIYFDLDVEDVNLEMDTGIPFGLNINELILDAMYNFKGDDLNIKFKSKVYEGNLNFVMIIEDYTKVFSEEDITLNIVNGLINQVDGDFSMENSDSNTIFNINLPIRQRVVRNEPVLHED